MMEASSPPAKREQTEGNFLND